MAGPNQIYAEEVLELLGFTGEPAGPPGAGEKYPVTDEVVESIKKLVGKAIIVADSGRSTIESTAEPDRTAPASPPGSCLAMKPLARPAPVHWAGILNGCSDLYVVRTDKSLSHDSRRFRSQRGTQWPPSKPHPVEKSVSLPALKSL